MAPGSPSRAPPGLPLLSEVVSELGVIRPLPWFVGEEKGDTCLIFCL